MPTVRPFDVASPDTTFQARFSREVRACTAERVNLSKDLKEIFPTIPLRIMGTVIVEKIEFEKIPGCDIKGFYDNWDNNAS